MPDTRLVRTSRLMINLGTLPEEPPTRMWAGPSEGGRQCGACGGGLATGELEYEVPAEPATIYMHVRCMELWAIEAQRPSTGGLTTGIRK